MKTSQEFSEIVKAMALVQGEITNPNMSGKNPHFKSKYATLPDILAAINGVAAKNGIYFSSAICVANENLHYCVTTVHHESGQFISDEVPLLLGNRKDMQALGSAITYARRYSLQNLFGLAGDESQDDDGNKTNPKLNQKNQGQQNRGQQIPRQPNQGQQKQAPKPQPTEKDRLVADIKKEFDRITAKSEMRISYVKDLYKFEGGADLAKMPAEQLQRIKKEFKDMTPADIDFYLKEMANNGK
jgi:hypothetical protein